MEKLVNKSTLEKSQEPAKANVMELDIDEIDDDMVDAFTLAVFTKNDSIKGHANPVSHSNLLDKALSNKCGFCVNNLGTSSLIFCHH